MLDFFDKIQSLIIRIIKLALTLLCLGVVTQLLINDKILGKIDQFGSITSVSCFSEVTAAQYNGNIKINATIKERIVKTIQDIVIFFVIVYLFPYLSKHNIAL